MVRFSPEGRVCSFCGLVAGKRAKLAGGLGVMICATCVKDFYEVLDSPMATSPSRRPPWEGLSDVDLLSKLPEIATVSEQVNEFMVEWVVMLRERGLSWAAIGQAMGVTRQAAWERFSRAEGSDRGSNKASG